MSDRTVLEHESPADALGLIRDAVWAALRADPTIGVAVVREDAYTVWCNRRSAEIFLGHESDTENLIGLSWSEHFSPDFIQQRVDLLRKIRESGRNVLLRSLWRGRQHGSWMALIDGTQHGDDPAQYLVITRRMDAREFAEVAARRDVDIIESNVVSLGELDKLTVRELEVLALLGQGLTIAEIGNVLGRSPKTVDRHRDKLSKKLGGSNRVELARIAFEAGLELGDAARTRL